MSTKTSIKRIALVAAAALTLGGFSAVSANAASAPATPFYVSAADSTSFGSGNEAAVMTATGIAGTYNYVAIQGNNTLAGTATLGIAVAGAGATLVVATQPTSGADTITVASTGLSATTTHAATNVTGAVVRIMTPTAGTVTVTISKNVDSSGNVTNTVLQTLTITVNAASVVGAYSAGNSFAVRVDTTTTSPNAFAILETATVTSATTDSSAAISKGTVGSPSAVSQIAVRLLDTQATPAALAAKTVTATISGVGLIRGTGIYNDTVTSYGQTASTVASSTTDDKGWAFFNVLNSGSAGNGTVTISYTDANGVTSVVSTKAFTFYGAVASLKAVQGAYIVANSGSATGGKTSTTYGVQITGADSAGNSVDITGLTIDVTSDATTQIATGTISVSGTQCAADAVNTAALDCTVTGLSGATAGSVVNVTYSYTDSSAVKYSATPIKFVIGGSVISSLAASYDKASYNIGDLVTMTLTAKDSKGNLVADKRYTIFDTTTSTTVFSTSAQITSTPFGSAYVTFSNGKATATFYAPFTTGDLNMTATTHATSADLATAAQAVAVAGKVSIAGAGGDSSLALDAANAATDAANNAYDEAQNATQAASDALAAVKALAVQVKALIALVTKIKNKVGA